MRQRRAPRNLCTGRLMTRKLIPPMRVMNYSQHQLFNNNNINNNMLINLYYSKMPCSYFQLQHPMNAIHFNKYFNDLI